MMLGCFGLVYVLFLGCLEEVVREFFLEMNFGVVYLIVGILLNSCLNILS